jgi:4-hydroxyphenylpyruvate dioxygenase-like putative hemolysin
VALAKTQENHGKETQMITRLCEVCINVKDFDEAVKKYSDVLGITPILMKAEDVPFPGVKVAIFTIRDISISLVGSDREDSIIAEALKTRGEGISLINFEVTDIKQTMTELLKKGVRFISDEPIPYIAGMQNYSLPESMHGAQICWSQHKPDWDVESPRRLWGTP